MGDTLRVLCVGTASALIPGLCERGYDASWAASVEERDADIAIFPAGGRPSGVPGMATIVLVPRERLTEPGVLTGADDFCIEPATVEEVEARIRMLVSRDVRARRLEAKTRRFERIALVDALTGLFNRRAFEDELERAWARASRRDEPLTLIMADLDRFKALNDRHGHTAGDAVLRAVGAALSSTIRGDDHAYRLGGEEFAVIAQGTPVGGALVLAERIRVAIASLRIAPTSEADAAPLTVTVSLGASLRDPAMKAPSDLVEAADRALYGAKAAGRNRIVLGGRRRAPAPAAAS